MDAASLLQNKAVVSLGAMMALRYTGYEIPVFEVRIAYAVCMLIQAALLGLLWMKLGKAPTGAKFNVREVDETTKGLKSVEYTHKEYDTKAFMKQLQQFGTSAAITVAMHMYGKYTTPMAIACLQPIFIAADPLFQIHVLGSKAEGKLARPFPDMATDMKIKMLEDQESPADATGTLTGAKQGTVIEDVTGEADQLTPKATPTGATKRRAKRT